MVIRIAFPIFGGGPPQGNRRYHELTVRNTLATELLKRGVSIDQVPHIIQTLIEQRGIPQLSNMLLGQAREVDTNIIKLCQPFGVELKPNEQVRKQAKFQQQAGERANRSSRNPDVTQYQLQHGFFLQADHSPSPIHSSFSPYK